MVISRKPLVQTIAAMSLLLAPAGLGGVSQADVALLIPGAMPFKQINPLYPSVAMSYPDIGKNLRGDLPWQIVQYSQDPLAADTGLRDGVNQTKLVVPADGKVMIIGESMGSMVAWRVAEELADSPTPPSTDDVSVVLIAPPEAGVAEYFKEGTYIPILNYTITRIRPSRYDTTIVIGEYDGWSDPPDRPWNLASSANALAGIAYVHGPPSFTASVDGLTPVDHVDGNDQHGSMTTYLLPSEHLPLTQVFRDVGVPDALVDKADEVLRPIVDAGYVRHDKPGDTRPYLHDGEIHRNVQSQQQARESSLERSGDGREGGAERRDHRSELRQAVHTIRAELRDRVEAGIGQLKAKIAGLRSGQAQGT